MNFYHCYATEGQHSMIVKLCCKEVFSPINKANLIPILTIEITGD